MKDERRKTRDERRRRGLIFVISGPSGSGKTTLSQKALQDKSLKNILARSVSLTTRPQRSAEVEGKDYFFVSERQFKEWRKKKKILEWTKYLGYYYATLKEPVERELAAGKHIILCLDLKGAARIKKLYPRNTVTIFVKPPSLDVLTERIQKRCHKTKIREIQKRVGLAEKELLAAGDYHHCLINQDLASVARELKNIILHNIKLHQTVIG